MSNDVRLWLDAGRIIGALRGKEAESEVDREPSTTVGLVTNSGCLWNPILDGDPVRDEPCKDVSIAGDVEVEEMIMTKTRGRGKEEVTWPLTTQQRENCLLG